MASPARSDRILSWSETADRSKEAKSPKKTSPTKSKIIEMINKRTGGPGLATFKNSLKSENDKVARHELNKLKARTGSQIDEEEKRQVRPKVNRVYNSIMQTLLRSI